MQQVAELAGVSLKTVSNVVNGYVHVSAATRERVNDAVAALGYQPNMAARNLAKGRTGLIALVLPHVDNPYFAGLAHNVIAEASRLDLTVLIEQTGGAAADERAVLQTIRGRLVDGVIFSPESLRSSDLEPGGPPLVLLAERAASSLPVGHIAIDEVAAAADATRHLIEIGRRRIALIGAQPGPAGPSPARTAGARRVIEGAGLGLAPDHIPTVGEYTRDDGYAAMLALLEGDAPPNGVFCFNDVLAMGALAAAHDRGVAVPAEVAVVGFDDIDECRFSIPPLTSIAPDHQLLARVAVERLLADLAGPTDPAADALDADQLDTVVPHRLVVRRSTVATAGRG